MLEDWLALAALLATLVGLGWAMSHAMAVVITQMNASVDAACLVPPDCVQLVTSAW